MKEFIYECCKFSLSFWSLAIINVLVRQFIVMLIILLAHSLQHCLLSCSGSSISGCMISRVSSASRASSCFKTMALIIESSQNSICILNKCKQIQHSSWVKFSLQPQLLVIQLTCSASLRQRRKADKADLFTPSHHRSALWLQLTSQ